jgi:hypothetical protein
VTECIDDGVGGLFVRQLGGVVSQRSIGGVCVCVGVFVCVCV